MTEQSEVEQIETSQHESRQDGAACGDPLLECLLLIARAHGGTLTREAALAGLPLDGRPLPPSLLGRAARRVSIQTDD